MKTSSDGWESPHTTQWWQGDSCKHVKPLCVLFETVRVFSLWGRWHKNDCHLSTWHTGDGLALVCCSNTSHTWNRAFNHNWSSYIHQSKTLICLLYSFWESHKLNEDWLWHSSDHYFLPGEVWREGFSIYNTNRKCLMQCSHAVPRPEEGL